jgi:hypothetical protein
MLFICAEYCYVKCKDFMSTSDKRRMMTWDRDKTDERKKIKKKTTSRKPCGWVYEEKKPALFDDDAPSPLEPRRPGSRVGVGTLSSSTSSSSARVDKDDDSDDDVELENFVDDYDNRDVDEVSEEEFVLLSDSSDSDDSSEASEVDSDIE